MTVVRPNILIMLVIAVLAAVSHSVSAQTSTSRAESHGWIAGQALEGPGGSLVHLPPREQQDAGTPGEAGRAWLARVLDTAPRAVTDWDRSVFLLYRRDRQWLDFFAIDLTRPVPSGAWLVSPSVGATALPSLDLGEAEYEGVAGSARGLLLLSRAETWTLHRLADRSSEWVAVALPEPVALADQVWLVADAEPPTLLTQSGTSLSAWAWNSDSAEEPGWSRTDFPEVPVVEADRVAGVFASGGDIIRVEFAPGSDRMLFESVGPGAAGRIAEVRLDGTPFAIEPLDAGRRVLIACEIVNPDAEGIAQPIRSWQFIELSMLTGRELYRGPPRYPRLAIGEGVRLLSLGMIAVSGCLLFYMLRPVPSSPHGVLPDGWVLATPGRRLFAGLLDAWLVVGVVGVFLGVPLGDFVLLLPLLESPRGVVAIGTVMIGGAVYSTACEWMLGCTLGKAAARLRVVSVDPSRPTLGLMRCGARNLFRWVLAPWAFVGLTSPDFRHRGDLATNAAVVIRPGRSDTPSPGSE